MVSFGYVGAGFGTVPHAGDSDDVDGLVELAVAASVQSVAGVLARGGLEGCDAGEASERGFVTASAGVGPGNVYLRGGDRTYPGLVQQVRSYSCDQFGDGCFQFGYLAGQSTDTPGYRTRGLFSGGEFVYGGGSESKPVAFGDQSSSSKTSELVPKINRGGH